MVIFVRGHITICPLQSLVLEVHHTRSMMLIHFTLFLLYTVDQILSTLYHYEDWPTTFDNSKPKCKPCN